MKNCIVLLVAILMISYSLVYAQQNNHKIPSSIQENSLLFHSWKIYSQYGEEGILDEILNRLQIKDGFFVEFGGWDGIHLSNTRFLAERGWRGVFIEADPELSARAKENYQNFPRIDCITEFVAAKPRDTNGKTIDKIADENFPNEEITVLSIDIDGADYLILENLKRKPKVIIIEGGISWSPFVTKRVPDFVARHQNNQPLSVIFDIAKKQGYQPVCFTINTFLVREDLIEPFYAINNDPVTLWYDSWHYYLSRSPEISSYIRYTKQTDKWVQQFDPYPVP